MFECLSLIFHFIQTLVSQFFCYICFLPFPFQQFLNVPMFRNVTLKCLTEIAGVNVTQYDQQFVLLFTLAMVQLKQVSSFLDLSVVTRNFGDSSIEYDLDSIHCF